MEMKFCNRCNKEKDINEFRSRKNKDKLNGVCRTCLDARSQFIKNNPEYTKNYVKENRQRIRNYSRAYHRRTYKRKVFNLDGGCTASDEIRLYVEQKLEQFRQEQQKMLSGLKLQLSF